MAAPPVIVMNPPTQSRRRRPRRVRSGPRAVSGGRAEKFTFVVDDIKANGSGVLKFGPSLTQAAGFSSGILKAYHEYRITHVDLQWISEASSTAAGALKYEIDPHRTLTKVESGVDRFSFTKNGRRTLRAGQINGTNWVSSTEDQFYIAYAGNAGKAEQAGTLRVTLTVQTQLPK